jgi:hypothetical protein
MDRDHRDPALRRQRQGQGHNRMALVEPSTRKIIEIVR